MPLRDIQVAICEVMTSALPVVLASGHADPVDVLP
jgi:hypothetical protein